MPKCLHSHHVTCGLVRHFVNVKLWHRRWLKLIGYLYYWMAMRSLEDKVAFCMYNKVQKGPGPYYALKFSQRGEPVKKLYFQGKKLDFQKLGVSGAFRQI